MVIVLKQEFLRVVQGFSVVEILMFTKNALFGLGALHVDKFTGQY